VHSFHGLGKLAEAKMLNDTHNSADTDLSAANRNGSPRWPLILAMGVGIIAALFTISLEHSVSLSFGNAGFLITAVVFPGMLGSIAVGGNAHAFSLWLAAGINFIFYFILVWNICGISRRILRRLR
jgi:hypothetical protein